MDAVVLAEVVGSGETETDAQFKVLDVLKGEKHIQVNQTIQAAYFGTAPKGSKFLIMAVDPPELLWSSPLPVSAKAIDYIKSIGKLPESQSKQLEFYLQFLENEESLLSRDAYDEFAQAPYADVVALKAKLDRPQLLKWIQDPNLPADHKRLYLVMLGICGKAEDADLIEKLLRSEDPNQRSGLDAMIACYVTLRGGDGLKLIDELFLGNKKSPYSDTYSAIQALRFHASDGNVVEKARVLKSMHLILGRPELADLVIPDLSRLEDWSQIDTLVNLFKTADDKSSWVRVPVINYLRACPLPEAAAQLGELEKIDPAAFKRATSFFPVPQPAAPSSKQSSSWQRQVAPAAAPLPRDSVRQSYASLTTDIPLAARSMTVRPTVNASVGADEKLGSNLGSTISVIAMAASTVTLAMWLAITGTGKPSVLGYLWVSLRTGTK
ncbi:MAG: hypothetical protein IT423_04285, partial [Pirellulaceae bacterium]|nr:hypothetical protein [Pirellulaceae bacterium]